MEMLQRFQHVLPLHPEAMPAVSPDPLLQEIEDGRERPGGGARFEFDLPTREPS